MSLEKYQVPVQEEVHGLLSKALADRQEQGDRFGVITSAMVAYGRRILADAFEMHRELTPGSAAVVNDPKDTHTLVQDTIFFGGARIIIGVTAEALRVSKMRGFWDEDYFFDLIDGAVSGTMIPSLSGEDIRSIRSEYSEGEEKSKIEGLLNPQDLANTEFFQSLENFPYVAKIYWNKMVGAPPAYLNDAMKVYSEMVSKVSPGHLTKEEERKLGLIKIGKFDIDPFENGEYQLTNWYNELEQPQKKSVFPYKGIERTRFVKAIDDFISGKNPNIDFSALADDEGIRYEYPKPVAVEGPFTDQLAKVIYDATEKL